MSRKRFECWFVVGWLLIATFALSESMWTFSKPPATPAKELVIPPGESATFHFIFEEDPATHELRPRAYGPNGEELEVEELPPAPVWPVGGVRAMSETI